jgi:hypothetical protein
MASAHRRVERFRAVRQFLSQDRGVDLSRSSDSFTGEGDHRGAGVEAGDLRADRDEFLRVQTRRTGGVQGPEAADRAEQAEDGGPVVVSVLGAVGSVLLEAPAHVVVDRPQRSSHGAQRRSWATAMAVPLAHPRPERVATRCLICVA